MLKALAYGTDDEILADFLASCGIDILGVATLSEGITLKEKCPHQHVFVINILPHQAVEAVTHQLEIGVSSQVLISAIGDASRRQNIITKVHLHLDTGMGRFGCRPEEALELAKMIQQHPHLALEGIMSHFSCADDPSQDEFTQHQIDLFSSTIFHLQSKGIYAKWHHIANSAGTIRFSIPICNMVRVGLLIYGIPNSKGMIPNFPFQPALTLKTRIVGINHCKENEPVGYKRSHRISTSSARIAVLPMGYFDGLHRNYSNQLEVLIRGKKAPLVGTICMDHVMADITGIPEAELGDSATLFGKDEFGNVLSPLTVAEAGNTIVHELLTCLGPRVQRVFIRGIPVVNFSREF